MNSFLVEHPHLLNHFLISYAGKGKPQLILLDHGLYKELDFETKTNYAALWKVCSTPDF